MTSILDPAAIEVQFAHVPQGSGVGASKDVQLRHFASMRAEVGLPTPRDPLHKKAWPILPARPSFWSVVAR